MTQHGNHTQYGVAAIPLSRSEIVEFLTPPQATARGAEIQILAQRPTVAAETAWNARLQTLAAPSITDLLDIDDPRHHRITRRTDRLVPIEFLADPNFLTRNLGGWAPVYFGVIGLDNNDETDPVLKHVHILTDYGDSIRYFGADPAQVEQRFETEMGVDIGGFVSALNSLYTLRRQFEPLVNVYIEHIYTALNGTDPLLTETPVPHLLLYDELMGQLVRLEAARRKALADGRSHEAQAIKAQQQAWRDQYGLIFMLKGEYIAGRHRRSTVLIAPELGVVVKQPAPEPFHEIELEAKTFRGLAENWPYTTRDGAVVTSRGRLRLVMEENIVPRLDQIFQCGIQFSTALGLTVEEFVKGQTVQEMVLADPNRFTSELYDEFVLHQQVCEYIGAENGDWHSANFVVRQSDGRRVHIDWGAARPLQADEYTPEQTLTRLNQVQNIAFSFHNDVLAARVLNEHVQLLGDQERLARIQRKAQAMVDAV
ncbi:MAG: hypothetical protein KDJ65_11115 [Anaerolineae bacterium]|nr:hypothetical protein [Anaerolineae bacterium]